MMKDHIPDYDPISVRGAGAFGYVIEAYEMAYDTRVAIKRTHKVGNKLSREFQILSELRGCEQCVQMLDTFYTVNDEGKVIQNVVFEYVPRSLEHFMEDYKSTKLPIPIEKIQSIMRQLITGLKYCHARNIVHRDLKPENVLFTEDERVKICDFGSSKFIDPVTKSTPYIVSRYYRAPELLLGAKDYKDKIDIFASGCIMAELFTLTPLFPGKSEGLQIIEQMCILGKPKPEYLKKFSLPQGTLGFFQGFEEIVPYDLTKILNKNRNYDETKIAQAADFIGRMICWDANERLNASQALEHPFLTLN